MSGESWYSITAQGAADAEVRIYDRIGGNVFGEGKSARQFVDELAALGRRSRIVVRINSPGGSAFDGIAMYNALRTNPAEIEVRVDGIAASAASVVAMAGNRIVMPTASLMMVHNPSGVTIGTAQDHRKTADALDATRDALVASYRGKTGLAPARLVELLDAETWMNGEEAHDLGFADVVEQSTPAEAHARIEAFDLAAFGYQRVPTPLQHAAQSTRRSTTMSNKIEFGYNTSHARDEHEAVTQAKSEWERDPDLRDEFVGDLERYLAFVRAEARGLVRIRRS